MLLYDIDDWRSDNARALQLARRIIGLTRLIPAHEFENLDGFVSIPLLHRLLVPVVWIQSRRADEFSMSGLIDPNPMVDHFASPPQGSQALPFGRRSVS